VVQSCSTGERTVVQSCSTGERTVVQSCSTGELMASRTWHARMRARARARTHTHTHTHVHAAAVVADDVTVKKQQRPASATSFKGGYGGVPARPTSAKARLDSAAKLVGRVFSVFEKKSATREVSKVRVPASCFTGPRVLASRRPGTSD
jgi:hypothetical protein